jgi:hypothetical protein
MRWHLFHLEPPKWLSMRYWGSLALEGADHGLASTEESLVKLRTRFGSRFQNLEQASEELLLHMDHRPKSRIQRAMCVINLNFDTLLVMVVLSLILLMYFPLGSLFA